MNWERLIEERNEWVAKNFPETTKLPSDVSEQTVLGCIEEVGELAHAHLKQEQNIRGSAEQHEEDAMDAIGDLSVYLMGVMSVFGPPRQLPVLATTSATNALLQLAAAVGTLGIRQSVYDIERIVGMSMHYCEQRGWDYESIVNETWEQVRKRDWVADPETGGEA